MPFKINARDGSVSFTLETELYSMDALRISGQVFSAQADVYVGEEKKAFSIILRPKRAGLDAPALTALAGEFCNELLNQEYRFIVGRFNHKVSNLIVTQALLAARGSAPREAPPEESTPEFMTEAAALVGAAEAEVARTMPKKLPDQGNPLPPAEEDSEWRKKAKNQARKKS